MKRGSLIYLIASVLIILAVVLIIVYGSQVKLFFMKTFQPEEETLSANLTASTCFDDESDIDYFTKGTVALDYQNGRNDLFTDYCKGTKLREFYCNSNNVKYVDYECEVGCFDGACIDPSQEEEIIDENLSSQCGSYKFSTALNAIAIDEFGGYSALNSIDGNLNTHWYGNPNSHFPKWIYFDFGEKTCISEVDLYFFKPDLPITGRLQASQDTLRWATISENLTITTLNQSVILPQVVTARYIRFFETSSGRSYGALTEARFNVAQLPEELR